MDNTHLPVAIIGAGPVGLATAAHLLARGITPLILEAGPEAGASIEEWAHVKMFSPWQFNVDKEAANLLLADGWTPPPENEYPTGRELLDRFVRPFADLEQIKRHLQFNTRVLAATRVGQDVMKTQGRSAAPFLLRVAGPAGEQDVLASAVIDASGTYLTPNWMGAHGIPALGEIEHAAHIAYGIPEVLGRARNRYANKRVLVVGGGHSAFNALQDLVRLIQEAPQTKVLWAIRGNSLERILGGGANDQLEERGKLGLKIRQLLNDGVIELFKNVAIDQVVGNGQGLVVKAGDQILPPVDQIIVATGFRPDMSLLAELRIALDPATQSAVLLAPMIDPNEHSCGTVRPHGAIELAHPEEGLFIVGMKSYGRAPTFLLMTGYEQVRSVVAALAGDWDAAKRVELILPETGICNSDFDEVDDRLKASASQTSCCGTGETILEAAPRTSPGCCKA
ncbi:MULTISPECIES: FAD-dependent oxidoreductase [Pseudomonas]|jgi:thioredoxin reductase|uniref:FAD-dependent oxidoreductase n=1 Tax=Pseudomonas TaxID=286 RepID=UPI0006532451|nr:MULTISPECIES: FAD-dependent oxidoreductase [Pseudomonas]KMM85093.1 flavoprotein [Pseudomonas lundensis]MBM3108077.1 FAD-dependent oxidoreductase [Pseudomonas arcuscaelestis]MCM8558596.1 NAD(P)-binding domain-containing protein [Pseudomonas shahriarae]NMX62370.1 FAD-dependent oxidoreductase [Pseudomonas sp. WS 5079]NNA22475.1 FAD-dependent oxidoreductase [Pseudomonas lundensis]